MYDDESIDEPFPQPASRGMGVWKGVKPQVPETAIELPKVYDPKQAERWYGFWEERGYFAPEIDEDKKPFVLSMPPPNVTGTLHLGHALTATIEDTMIRYHRMAGDPTLWLPGTDHAGIATEYVVKRLLEEEGTSREALGREVFIRRVWEWKERSGGLITEQHRRLGVSCDWGRERFTMDERLSQAVRETFIRLYEKGLIYRGEYLINWCPKDLTALADLEVEHEAEEGKLYYVRYRLVDSAGIDHEYVTVATTRPETILGDTAVAVHPQDDRYYQLVGRDAILPVLGRSIPIIADEVVDPEFGTGAVKVTPAHDPTDYDIGRRRGLPSVNIMNPDGTLNGNAGPGYDGLDRYEARRKLVAQLEEEGLLIKVEEHSHSVGRCYRCSTVVEPLLSTQWFLRMKPLAEPAIRAVEEGEIRIIPARFTKIYLHWMENIRDWCISRQLWWGHRIPVWHCTVCGEIVVAREDPGVCPRCGSPVRQDDDVLDTWFSSALWPFSTLGWPDETEDYRYFYPTTVMETGYDILFFWVARMIMMGLECTGKVPFTSVYLHGLIRDEKGQKMSKTKGNVVDPLDVMEEFGTDALRFTLSRGSTPGNDMRLGRDRLEGSRNFANKLWNASRLVLTNLEGRPAPVSPGDGLTLADRWILSRAQGLIRRYRSLLDNFEFGEAAQELHQFIWSEYCDWYLEMAKGSLYGEDSAAKDRTRAVLRDVLDTTLRLLHPYMPFITEEIWQRLREHLSEPAPDSLMIAEMPWRRDEFLNAGAEEEMQLIQDVVTDVRRLRSELSVPLGAEVTVSMRVGDERLERLVGEAYSYLTKLARIGELKVGTGVEKPPSATSPT